MHNSRKVFLLDKEPRCILATYEADEHASTKEYKTFDPEIKAGDYIVVPSTTRHEMTINKVKAVDVEPDLDSEQKMAWVVGVVDKQAYDKTVASETQFLSAALSAEKKRKKEQLKKDFLADVPDDMAVIGHTPSS